MTTAPLSDCTIEYTLTLRIPASRPVAFYLASHVRAAARTVCTWRARTRQRRALAHLDGRLLQDVGITHAARSHEIIKPFWQV